MLHLWMLQKVLHICTTDLYKVNTNTIFPSILGFPSLHVPTEQTLIILIVYCANKTPDYLLTKRQNIPRQRTSGLCVSLLSQSAFNLHGMETESIGREF